MKLKLDEYMKLDYATVITKLKDDCEEYYKVWLPDLPGLTIFVDSKEEIEEELEDAKKAWFASRIKHNQKIPLPQFNLSKSGRITLRVPKSLHAELEYKADEEGISLNQFLNHLIERGLEKDNVTNKNIVNEFFYNQYLTFKQENNESFSIEPLESSDNIVSIVSLKE